MVDSAQDLWRTLALGLLTYGVLIAILRASGKRTLAKLNAFDFVVTIALGSTLAIILLSTDATLSRHRLSYTTGALVAEKARRRARSDLRVSRQTASARPGCGFCWRR